jgi:hypothetical protein
MIGSTFSIRRNAILGCAMQSLSDRVFWSIWPKPHEVRPGVWQSFRKSGVGFQAESEADVFQALADMRADMADRASRLIWC